MPINWDPVFLLECGSVEVDHAHILWYYPHIQSFRERIGHLILLILGFGIDMKFFSFNLGAIREGFCQWYLPAENFCGCKKAVTTPLLTFNQHCQLFTLHGKVGLGPLQEDRAVKYCMRWDCYLQEMDTD